VQDAYGSSEVLRVEEVPVPSVKPNEVLIRVKAAGIDAGAWHLMTGIPYLVRLAIGLKKPRSRTVGADVAGSIESIGAQVTGFSVGDEVFGAGSGTFAEFAVAREDKIVRKPANVSFEQAAATAISGVTALQAVRAGSLKAGQRVLVLGASGGVGSFAVQLAKSRGAWVTGVGSASKLDFIRSLGADEALDYAATDVTDGIRTFDLVIDTGGNRPLARVRRALTPTGTLIIVGGDGGGPMLQGLERTMGAGLLSPFVKQKLAGLVSVVKASDLAELAQLLESGAIVPRVDRVFPLEDAPAAMAYFEQRQARGKVVISM
jgi:NADPH:quinone reductase-like Zn-dependent oxidoreductase